MSADTVLVWNVTTDEMQEVPRAEAAAGLVRYARSLGAGSPACGEVERQATETLHDERVRELFEAGIRAALRMAREDLDALAQWETDGGA